MIPFFNIARHLIWVGLAVALAGCGGGSADQLKYEPVVGAVILDGKPAAGIGVNFIPVAHTPGLGAGGLTDKDGKYTLTSPDGRKGAPAGEYRVMISKLAKSAADASLVFPIEFRGTGGRELKATVREGDNAIDFQVTQGNVPRGVMLQ